MATSYGTLDWIVLASYVALLFGISWYFNRQKSEDTKDYFLGGNQMSYWVVAFSVLATTQSAATFLGGPDQGFRGNYTYVTATIGAIIAALLVSRLLIPKFYAHKVATVYELLGLRYGEKAMKSAGLMYLFGRLFASGARLYLAAIAVSMILYANIDASSIVSAAFIMTALGFLVTFLGGIRSVIWSDLIQFLIYFCSALAVLLFLYFEIPASGSDIYSALANAPDGQNKLQFFNFDWDFSDPFTFISILTGIVLINFGNAGLDQDTTQRLLTCKNEKEGSKSLIISTVISVPLIFIFISIGQLLHIFYERPDLMQQGVANTINAEFSGEKITIFMNFILTQIPDGLKGLVTVGVLAAAISTINSGLNSMSSVVVQDFYRPWKEKRAEVSEKHYVIAGRFSMAFIGTGLFLMAVLCFYWQQYTDMALLNFALSVMVFAYSGLLGVYFTVIFTKRGSANSVIAALIVGFTATLLQQSYVVDVLGLPESWKGLAFSWQLCIGTTVAFIVCMLGNKSKSLTEQLQ